MPPTLDVRTTTAPPRPATAVVDPTPSPPVEPTAPLTWETQEYEFQKKTALWYAIFGVILALLIFSAILTRSFLSGVVFVLSGVLILLYSERPPRTIRFSLTKDALRINDRRYPYSSLEAFNVVDSPTGPLALFRSRRLVMPLIHMPLGDQDPDAVRTVLRPRLREDPDLHESLVDLLAHWLGF